MSAEAAEKMQMKKMKPKASCRGGFLSGALILEGMRRTKYLAFVMIAVTWAAAVLIPLRYVAEAKNSLMYNPGFIPTQFGFLQLNPLLLMSFMAYAPFLTLMAFGFLNNRSGSDMFHASYVRRPAVAASFYISVAAWIVITISGGMGITLLMTYCFRSLIRFSAAHMVPCFIQLLVCSLLVEGSVLIAMALTGTVLTNLTAALLIIFFPQMFVTIAKATLLSLVPMLCSGHLSLLLEGRLNSVTGIVFSITREAGARNILYKPYSIGYTACIAVLYAAAGVFLYVKRPSETAGRPAASEKLQSILRTLISFVIAAPFLVGASSLLKNLIWGGTKLTGNGDLSNMVFGMVISLLASIGSIVAYELVTSRRMPGWRRFGKSILVLACLCLIWICAALGTVVHFRGESIPEDQIKSVSFSGQGGDITNYYLSINTSGYDQSYWGIGLGKATLSGRDFGQVVSMRAYEAAQEVVPGSEGKITVYEGSNEYLDGYLDGGIPTKITMKNGRTIYRNLKFTVKDIKRIWNYYAGSEDGKTMLNIPEYKKLNSCWSGRYINNDSLVYEHTYETFREELRKTDALRLAELLEDKKAYEKNPVLQFTAMEGIYYVGGSVPVTRKDFPETRALLDKKAD